MKDTKRIASSLIIIVGALLIIALTIYERLTYGAASPAVVYASIIAVIVIGVKIGDIKYALKTVRRF
jgi:hypothetical protein